MELSARCVQNSARLGVGMQIGDGAYALACALEPNRSLERLGLQYNDISDAVALSCHAPLSKNRALTSFDLA